MKTLEIGTGGHQRSNNDIIHLQDSLVECVLQLSKSLSGTNETKVVLHGFEVTKVGSNYTHTAGYILYNGETYVIDELASPLVDTGTPKLAIDLTWGANNPVEYYNGTTKNVHATRKLKLVLSTDTGEFNYNDASLKPLKDLMRTRLGLDSGVWVDPIINLANWEVVDYLPKCKKENLTVTLRASIRVKSTVSATICVLPDGYRPSESIHFSVAYINAIGDWQPNRILITTSGQVILYASPTNNEVIKFDITFRID